MPLLVVETKVLASKQLADFSRKAEGTHGVHQATIFKLPVSTQQEKKIRRKLAESKDEVQRKRLSDSLARRQANPYGLLFTPTGSFIEKPEYQNLKIVVV